MENIEAPVVSETIIEQPMITEAPVVTETITQTLPPAPIFSSITYSQPQTITYSQPQTFVQPIIAENLVAPVVTEPITEYSQPQTYVQPTITQNVVAPMVTEDVITYAAPQEVTTGGFVVENAVMVEAPTYTQPVYSQQEMIVQPALIAAPQEVTTGGFVVENAVMVEAPTYAQPVYSQQEMIVQPALVETLENTFVTQNVETYGAFQQETTGGDVMAESVVGNPVMAECVLVENFVVTDANVPVVGATLVTAAPLKTRKKKATACC